MRLSPKTKNLKLILLVVISALLFAHPLTSSENGEEAIEVIGERFDFGYVPFGTTIKHRATLINRSDSLIKITKVVPGCGCTQVPLKTKQIAPGDSLEVEMLLETGKIRAGLFQKGPMIFTDNRETPRVSITLTGVNLKSDDRRPSIRLEPPMLSLIDGEAGTTSTIEVINQTSEKLFPQLAEIPNTAIMAIELPVRQIMPGRRETINITVSPMIAQDFNVEESFTLIFNDQQRTRYTIPVVVRR